MNTENRPITAETSVLITQGVVSRRNQDGTVILMKLDESNLFFKIDGLAAALWGEYENPVTLNVLLEKYHHVVKTRPELAIEPRPAHDAGFVTKI